MMTSIGFYVVVGDTTVAGPFSLWDSALERSKSVQGARVEPRDLYRGGE
jgi:hypothetical protein